MIHRWLDNDLGIIPFFYFFFYFSLARSKWERNKKKQVNKKYINWKFSNPSIQQSSSSPVYSSRFCKQDVCCTKQICGKEVFVNQLPIHFAQCTRKCKPIVGIKRQIILHPSTIHPWASKELISRYQSFQFGNQQNQWRRIQCTISGFESIFPNVKHIGGFDSRLEIQILEWFVIACIHRGFEEWDRFRWTHCYPFTWWAQKWLQLGHFILSEIPPDSSPIPQKWRDFSKYQRYL